MLNRLLLSKEANVSYSIRRYNKCSYRLYATNAIYASVQGRSKGTVCAIDRYALYPVTLQERLNYSHRLNPAVSINHLHHFAVNTHFTGGFSSVCITAVISTVRNTQKALKQICSIPKMDISVSLMTETAPSVNSRLQASVAV